MQPQKINVSDRMIHLWETIEIRLTSTNEYANPYTEVECWVDLQGPGFNKRIYGFWDGGNNFLVRLTATCPGEWHWISNSNQNDAGLNGQSGTFTAVMWSGDEIDANPLRHGFLTSTPQGHSLQHTDGYPFFLLGDTWWSASTFRFPLTGNTPDPSWHPGPEQFSFENALLWRKQQGYNSIALIAAYPNWDDDAFPHEFIDENSIGIRQAWEKSGCFSAKDMHDEYGNRPFALKDEGPLADYDRINPAYFRSLDKKIAYMNEQGFIPLLEVVRRDHGPSWKAYFEWPDSFIRFVQYMAARYGAFNLIFSPIHLDWIPEDHSLSGAEFNQALIEWHRRYGPLPFGQPTTVLIDNATHITLGQGEDVPWLTMHSVGNGPRNHGFYPLLHEQFHIQPPLPTANLEPYYPGWNHPYHNLVVGERPEPDSERDHYFGRTQAWGSVFSGALTGHIYGSGAYCGNTVGEPPGIRPYIWEGLAYASSVQLQHLRTFVESIGKEWSTLEPHPEWLNPSKSPTSHPQGLDGWSFLLSEYEKKLVMLYFEYGAIKPILFQLLPGRTYTARWFNPIIGKYYQQFHLITNELGELSIPDFPESKNLYQDWCLILRASRISE